MTRRATAVGLCVVCALAFSAIASHAAAEVPGTTMFTCKENAGTTFSDAHCKNIGPGNFAHVQIAEGTVTETVGDNITTGTERSVFKLESKQAGIAMQIVAKKVTATGSTVNKKDASGEHYGESEITLALEEAEVAKPAGKGCKVKGGKIVTKKLKKTTTGQGHFVRYAPVEGVVIAEYEIEGCSIAALNGVYKLEGSFKLVPNGATEVATHIPTTTDAGLASRGQVTGIDASLTWSGRLNNGQPYTPLSMTTVITP